MSIIADMKKVVKEKFKGRTFVAAYEYDSKHVMLEVPPEKADMDDYSLTQFVLINKKTGDWRWFYPTENLEKFSNMKKIEV